MSSLKKNVVHPCARPVLEDPSATHIWTCPECKSEWIWHPPFGKVSHSVERYGFLWRKQRMVEDFRPPGYWVCVTRIESWVEVQ